MSDVEKSPPPLLQVHLHLTEPAATERLAAWHLGPGLTALTRAGAITGWHFVRKGDRWRLRYQPATADSTDAATAAVDTVMEDFRTTGALSRWTPVIYEPETIAFGGDDAMEAAHRLFHLDSHHTLAYLRAVHASEVDDQRRELSLLLGTAMMRGAGLDWYEIGDTWAKIAQHRPTVPETDGGRRLHQTVAVLLQADTGPTSALLTTGQLAFAAPWFAAFTACGRGLRTLADSGRLRRGLRAVLAHHQLFHSNRLGLTHDHQALLAHAATATVLEPTQEPA
ncbi:thiopeptide-type bacteriocin biosynthesis protein [Kitasatospora sp. NPDC057500]|uniref:thiopeptide-type bacteriocin biosynthesis protein n=1 Tax=Kitasatospora sp. NPDC057500 TaxID=3346151 RepID=UPI0036755473